jgi:lycopene beta-cyclase
MDSARYLLLLGGCAALTLPLEWVFGARVYRRPRRLAVAVLPVLAIFITWDLVGHARGDWWYTARYLTGVRLLGLPVEEWLFFMVIPVCAVLTFEAFGHPARRARARAAKPSIATPPAAEARTGRPEGAGGG